MGIFFKKKKLKQNKKNIKFSHNLLILIPNLFYEGCDRAGTLETSPIVIPMSITLSFLGALYISLNYLPMCFPNVGEFSLPVTKIVKKDW